MLVVDHKNPKTVTWWSGGFQRLFTIMVTVKGPICNVIRIGCYLLSEVSAEPPTVYRIVSPAHTGKIIVTQKAEFVK